MAHRPPPPRPLRRIARSPVERLAAWLYTGPLGHLYGMAADVVQVGVRHLLGRARARVGQARAQVGQARARLAQARLAQLGQARAWLAVRQRAAQTEQSG